MAILSNIAPNKNYVIVEATSGTAVTVATPNAQMGTVRFIWYNSVTISVGKVVLYTTKNAVSFEESGTTYQIIPEDDIKMIYTAAT